MDKRRLEWTVGLFVLIGLVLLALLLVQFSKGASWFKPTYNLYLVTRNVGGLKVNASVLMSGVKIGSATEIHLNPTGTNVTITLSIFKPYIIHKDARFTLEQSGFLGDMYVAVVPTQNEAPTYEPEEHARAEEPFNLQDAARSATGFIQRIDETAKRLNETIVDVRRLVLNEETLTNLAITISTMRHASEGALIAVGNVNTLLDTNTPSIALAVSNLVYFSDQMNTLGTTFGNVLTTNTTEITLAVSNVASSTSVLKLLLDDLASGKGLAGTLLRSDQVATDFQEIAANLSLTTSNLNRIGLWGILWSQKPPRTNRPTEPLQSPKTPY